MGLRIPPRRNGSPVFVDLFADGLYGKIPTILWYGFRAVETFQAETG
jgi:hypothetical protein